MSHHTTTTCRIQTDSACPRCSVLPQQYRFTHHIGQSLHRTRLNRRISYRSEGNQFTGASERFERQCSIQNVRLCLRTPKKRLKIGHRGSPFQRPGRLQGVRAVCLLVLHETAPQAALESIIPCGHHELVPYRSSVWCRSARPAYQEKFGPNIETGLLLRRTRFQTQETNWEDHGIHERSLGNICWVSSNGRLCLLGTGQ